MAQQVNQLEIIKRENPLAYNSIVSRLDESARESRISQEIRALYPKEYLPVVIKMKSGQILNVGFDLALATLMRGDAELVKPPAVRLKLQCSGRAKRAA